MKARDLLFRMLAVVAGAQICVMVLLGSIGMREGMAKTLAAVFLLSLFCAPFLYWFVGKRVARRLSGQTLPSGESPGMGSILHSLTSNVPGIVYRGQRDWSLSFVSAEVESVTGYTGEEFLRGVAKWKEIIHFDDLERVKESFRTAVRERLKTLRVEYRIRHRNGDIRWIADRRQMMYNNAGAFDYVDGLILDITERKETDRRLAESEYRFRTITDTAPTGVVTADSAGTIDFFNRAAERMFGYTSDEIVGRNVTILIPERFREAHRTGLNRFRRTGETRIIGRTVELEAQKKDGSEFPIELSLGTWGKREAPCFSAIVRDITERRQWEDDRRESEEKFRVIFEEAKDGILLSNIETKRFVTGNRAICDMLGYSLEEIQRLGVADIHPEEELPRILDLFERQGRQASEIANEIPVQRKDGSVFFAEIKTSPVTISGTGYLIGNFRDVTERRTAERTLTRLGLAVDQAAEAVVVTDTAGNIEYVNPAFERITGYSLKEAIGCNLRMLKSGKHDDAFYQRMWETISHGEVWSGRFVNRKKDGTLYDEECTISPVRDASGKIVNFVAGKRDVTREMILQKQLQTAQRMESVGTFAGGVAHDFNNALTGVLGFGEMLKQRLAGDPSASADVEQILRSAERASTLTRQLLAFARRQVIEPVHLDLSKVVLDLSKLLRQVIGEHIEVKISQKEDLPSVFADPGQMEQVLMNLALNARDAMPSGGHLLIGTEVVSVGRKYVRSHPYMKEGRYVLLTVSDTGIGMEANTLERIFDPFFTTKGPEKGTGLGLAVVYGIVKQHNGFIHVYSEPGIGTTFKILLTAVDAGADATAEWNEETVCGGTETILLAEDDGPVRMLVERTLKECGYRVLPACNGEEAVEIFRQNAGEIQLAILDVVMPKKGGKEAFEEMHTANPALKVIYTSGYTADAVHESFVLRPGVSFLQKPFGLAILAGKVREVLDSR
jgi:PAS domain S-box-containing protein